MTDYEKGKIIKGSITHIETYGAFMIFDKNYTGLIHVSEISNKFVRNINDYVNINDTIYVEILDIDNENKHLKLSIKNINYKTNGHYRRKKIIETPSGFSTLKKNLPLWIENKLKFIEKNKKTVDK